MDKKILAGIAVVIVVAAAASAIVIMNNGGDEHKSDYTLLDNLDDIKAGFVYGAKGTEYGAAMNYNFKVTKVENKDYTVETNYDMEIISNDYLNGRAYLFTPSEFESEYGYDYTDTANLPDTVKVTVDGNKYTINGKYTLVETNYTNASDMGNLAITLVDGSVTKVEGKMKTEFKTKEGDYTSTDDLTLTALENGKIQAKGRSVEKSTDVTTLDSIKSNITLFDKSRYDGADIAESTEKYGNVDAKVYTINGTSHGTFYEAFKAYTYNGYMIKVNGYIDGEKQDATTYIYYE